MEQYWQREVRERGRPYIDLFGLGASYFDEAEPRLAILGPPAVTRLMVELWRADPQVRSRFDLATRCIAEISRCGSAGKASRSGWISARSRRP
jgi:hypothetical protein